LQKPGSIAFREKTLSTKETSDPKANPVEAVKTAAAEHIVPKPTRQWRARVFQAYLLLSTVTFGALVVLANMFDYFPFDLAITRAIQTVHALWFYNVMIWLSYFGYLPQVFVMIGLIAAMLFTIGLRWEAVVALIAAGGAAVLATLIKFAVHRPRPGADLVTVIQQLPSYSFPSGHVLTYTAFFGFLFFLSYALLKIPAVRVVVLVMLGGIIALIGVSRIYVGDHWASDVLGAYLLGSLWLVVCVQIYQWGKTRFFVRQPLASDKPDSAARES
jgi:membrane-associated phospholipid phosphatase